MKTYKKIHASIKDKAWIFFVYLKYIRACHNSDIEKQTKT